MNPTSPSMPTQAYLGATDFSAAPINSFNLPPLSSDLLLRVAARAKEKMEVLGLRADGNFVTFSESDRRSS